MCARFDGPNGPPFDEHRARELLSAHGSDIEAKKNLVVSDADLEDVSGDVAALLVFDTDTGTGPSLRETVQQEFDDVVVSTGRDEETQLETVFCRGPATRVRELVAQLRDDESVTQTTVNLLRVRQE